MIPSFLCIHPIHGDYGGGRIASGTAIEYTKAFQFKYLEIFHDELMKLSVINDNAMIFFVFSATAPALLYLPHPCGRSCSLWFHEISGLVSKCRHR